jgi:hypothetical protein
MEGAATVSGCLPILLLLQPYSISAPRTIGSEWVSPFTAVGGVINGNQTTTLNGAKYSILAFH